MKHKLKVVLLVLIFIAGSTLLVGASDNNILRVNTYIYKARQSAFNGDYESALNYYEEALKNWNNNEYYFFTLPLIIEEIERTGLKYQIMLAGKKGEELGQAILNGEDTTKIKRKYEEKEQQIKYRVEDITGLVSDKTDKLTDLHLMKYVDKDFNNFTLPEHIQYARALSFNEDYESALNHYEAALKVWNKEYKENYVFNIELIKEEIQIMGNKFEISLAALKGEKLAEAYMDETKDPREVERAFDKKIAGVRQRVEDILNLP
ncbi:hypothetical protein [Halothermothrix orenii]|uniref:Tetratricopeptide repeat protein n=1 Tax=Halothermothrix orenii (strain H 168 / OCM 544 / DSM 9562) TaxID=373903 RepID=B8CYE7_HALOH|nr:hypothetical protein [Halothermothrix orenii]ACL70316.1 hypothetical protein Hore_15670 [Halothermothrix orenii H 168]